MRYRTICSVSALFAGLLAAPLHASARTFTFPQSGSMTIGMIGPQAVGVFRPSPSGSCILFGLGTGGLDEDLTIIGSSGSDTIRALTTNTTECDRSLTPLVSNGRAVTIRAGRGNDAVQVFNIVATTLRGEGGPDVMMSDYGLLYGGAERDYLVSGWASQLRGEADNDWLCTITQRLSTLMDGGSGTDTYCGQSNSIVSAQAAPSCGFGPYGCPDPG